MEPHNHEQFIRGRQRLARAIHLLLTRNDISQREMDILAKWAAPDDQAGAWLAKSQISTLLNAKLLKPGAQIFLALSQLNAALAGLALGEKPRRPLPASLRRLAVEPGPWWLAHPVTGAPLSSGDWFQIYVGEFSTDELEDGLEIFSDETARLASDRLALQVQGWMASQRLNWRQGRDEIAGMYQGTDRNRRARLFEVLTGDRRFSGAELDEDREALRFLVGRLLGRDALSVREFDCWVRGQLRE